MLNTSVSKDACFVTAVVALSTKTFKHFKVHRLLSHNKTVILYHKHILYTATVPRKYGMSRVILYIYFFMLINFEI
jgi:hypothetical protein